MLCEISYHYLRVSKIILIAHRIFFCLKILNYKADWLNLLHEVEELLHMKRASLIKSQSQKL